jgi:plasmid stabilization system protein ParE
MPESRGLLQGAKGKKIVYRRVMKWAYRIIFTIIESESEKQVLVVRIDHSKRNPASLKDLPG